MNYRIVTLLSLLSFAAYADTTTSAKRTVDAPSGAVMEFKDGTDVNASISSAGAVVLGPVGVANNHTAWGSINQRVSSIGTTTVGAAPGISLNNASMNATNRYTPALKFTASDTDFTDTTRWLAGIIGDAEGTFTDATSPMGMHFLTTRGSQGPGSTPAQVGYVSSNGSWFLGPNTEHALRTEANTIANNEVIIAANAKISFASLTQRNLTTRNGAGLYFGAFDTDSSDPIRFFTNQDDDLTSTNGAVVASSSATGRWIFGPTGFLGTHLHNGEATFQANQNANTTLLVDNGNSGSSAYAEVLVTTDHASNAGMFRNSIAQTSYAGSGSLNIGSSGAVPVGIVHNNTLRLKVTNDIDLTPLSGTGNVTITATGGQGGNVPFSCTRRTATSGAGATVHSLSCTAGEIIMGGGCDSSSATAVVESTYPNSSTSWTCNYDVATQITVYGICCAY